MDALLGVVDEELFVTKLFERNEVNTSALELSAKSLRKMRRVLDLKFVASVCVKNELIRYRLVCFASRFADDATFALICERLRIDDAVLTQTALFRYPETEFLKKKASYELTSPDFQAYHDKVLLSWTIESVPRFVRILKLIPHSERVTHLIDHGVWHSVMQLQQPHRTELAAEIWKAVDDSEQKALLLQEIVDEAEREQLKGEIQ